MSSQLSTRFHALTASGTLALAALAVGPIGSSAPVSAAPRTLDFDVTLTALTYDFVYGQVNTSLDGIQKPQGVQGESGQFFIRAPGTYTFTSSQNALTWTLEFRSGTSTYPSGYFASGSGNYGLEQGPDAAFIGPSGGNNVELTNTSNPDCRSLRCTVRFYQDGNGLQTGNASGRGRAPRGLAKRPISQQVQSAGATPHDTQPVSRRVAHSNRGPSANRT